MKFTDGNSFGRYDEYQGYQGNDTKGPRKGITMRLDFENAKRYLNIKKETFNIKIQGRKLEVSVESDNKLDNGVKFKNGHFEK